MTDYRIKWDNPDNVLRFVCVGEGGAEDVEVDMKWDTTLGGLRAPGGAYCGDQGEWDESWNQLQVHDDDNNCCPNACHGNCSALSCCDQLANTGIFTVAGNNGTSTCEGSFDLTVHFEQCGWYTPVNNPYGPYYLVDLCYVSGAYKVGRAQFGDVPGGGKCADFDFSIATCVSAGDGGQAACQRIGSFTDGTISVDWVIGVA